MGSCSRVKLSCICVCVLCVWQEPNAFDDFYNFDVISFVNDVVDGYVTLGPGPLGFIQIEEPCFYKKIF